MYQRCYNSIEGKLRLYTWPPSYCISPVNCRSLVVWCSQQDDTNRGENMSSQLEPMFTSTMYQLISYLLKWNIFGLYRIDLNEINKNHPGNSLKLPNKRIGLKKNDFALSEVMQILCKIIKIFYDFYQISIEHWTTIHNAIFKFQVFNDIYFSRQV